MKSWNDLKTSVRKNFLYEDNLNEFCNKMTICREPINENEICFYESLNPYFNDIKEQVAIGTVSDNLSTFVL